MPLGGALAKLRGAVEKVATEKVRWLILAILHASHRGGRAEPEQAEVRVQGA
jgi:hypothetical protein